MDNWPSPQMHVSKWLKPELSNAGLQADVLRLDLLHPILSGNKWLKLQGWLQTFTEKKYSGIASIGGPWSNHLHALAYACHQAGIPLSAHVKGNAENPTAMLMDCMTWGAEINYYHGDTSAHAGLASKEAEAENRLWIPMGGDGLPGEQGVTEVFHRLNLSSYEQIWVAVGSGTTLRGMLKAIPPTITVNGISPGINHSSLLTTMQGLHDNLVFHPLQGRFGKITPELIQFISDCYTETALPLDAIYTARLFGYWLHLANNSKLKPGSRHLLVHTGGLQGNRSVAALANLYPALQ